MRGATIPLKVALITLGCPKNLVDAEVMLGLLDQAGHSFTEDLGGADVVIVNTCAFISAAIQESRDVIEECISLKEGGALGRIVVAGCLPQRLGERLLCLYPQVDAVIGCSHLFRIADTLDAVSEGERVATIGPGTAIYDHTSPRVLATPSHLAYVKIADGCSNRCTYCTIPSIRGPARSRDPDSVLAEARGLLERGVKEINLIAQDTAAYGTDIAPDIALPGLLRRLSKIGIPWIRVLYAHPAHVTADLVSAIAEEDAIVPYIDIPIQHISDTILRGMGRKITGRQIRMLVEGLRRTVPGVTIRSSVMVGFPGEGEAEFGELLGFIAEGNLDYLGIFEFSPEPETPAFEMRPRVPRDIATARAMIIMKTMQELAARHGRSMLGQEVDVMVDSVSPEVVGHTAEQAWEMDGAIRIRNEPTGRPLSPGAFVRARIVEVSGFDLVAQP